MKLSDSNRYINNTVIVRKANLLLYRIVFLKMFERKQWKWNLYNLSIPCFISIGEK